MHVPSTGRFAENATARASNEGMCHERVCHQRVRLTCGGRHCDGEKVFLVSVQFFHFR